ncbi:hypothetical protein ACFFX0_11780 [Citricoccus parietis]|uniref:Uncharacterized protein n=1 Tax=Citricoccus parietis TaxID=592307 RepID=A0ABV5FYU8_9MICC
MEVLTCPPPIRESPWWASGAMRTSCCPRTLRSEPSCPRSWTC